MKTCPVLVLVLLLLGLCARSAQGCDRRILKREIYGGRPVGNLIYGQTAQTCQGKCTANPRCVYFIFTGRFCQLRSGPVKGSQPSVIWAGYSLNYCKLPPIPAPKCGPQPGVNMQKGAYKVLKDVPSVQACEQKCNQNSACTFYTYLSDQWTADVRKYSCFLKSGKPTAVSKYPGMISGYADRACK
ncbi:hypothetical protein NL108_018253 [Boleophthalmus pectinirostris]|uniref:plasma kallikrein-like n=1 Tax=Boleophthalmus pectinirostris TaxID=150288 RepID=UPI0024302FD0|nr:plasma kallikrein-like [Boleophthalmus pectinirostris]KAJ0056824.1 hypothetical protein NL108_018253 [Boleophthalmus pectinirostris]